MPAGGTLQRGPGRRGRVRDGGGRVPPALTPHVTRDHRQVSQPPWQLTRVLILYSKCLTPAVTMGRI